MTERDHERIEALLSARVLGALEADDDALLRELLAEHGACEQCRTLEDDYAEVAGRLAFALAPAELRPAFEEEVVAAATRGDATSIAVATQAGKDAAPDAVAARARTDRRGAREGALVAGGRAARRARARRASPWRGIAAAAVAAALFVGGWVARDVAGTPEPAFAGVRVVAFHRTRTDAGNVAVAYRPSSRGAFLFGSGLRSPASGHVLEVWMIDGSRITPGPCLRPARDGSLATFVDADLGSTETMAVTVEPEGCPSAPTTDPILTADLASPRASA